MKRLLLICLSLCLFLTGCGAFFVLGDKPKTTTLAEDKCGIETYFACVEEELNKLGCEVTTDMTSTIATTCIKKAIATANPKKEKSTECDQIFKQQISQFADKMEKMSDKCLPPQPTQLTGSVPPAPPNTPPPTPTPNI